MHMFASLKRFSLRRTGSTRSDRDAALSATTPAKQRLGLPATFTSRLGPGPNGNKSSSTLSVTSPHGGRPALDGNLSASSTSTAVSSSSGHAGYGQTDKGFEAGGLYGRPHSLSFDLPPGAAAPQLATVEAAADDLSMLPADLAAYEASASMASFGQSGHGHENIMPSTSTSSLTSSNVHAIQHHAHSQLPYDDSAAGAASIPQTNSVTSTPRPGPMPQQQSEPRRTNSAFVFVRGAKLVNVPDKGQDPFGSDAARAGRRRSQFLDQAAPDHAVFPVITPPTQVPVSVPVMEPVAPPAKKQSLPSRSVPASPSMPASVPTSPQQKKDKPPSAFASLVSFGRKRSSSTSDAPLNPSESTLKRAPSGAVSDASHSSSGTIRPSNGTRKLSKRLGKPLPPPTLEAVSPSPVDEEPSAVPSQSHAPLPQQAKDDAVMAPPVRKPSLLRSRTAPDERPSPTVSASSAVPPVPALKKSSPPPALSDSSRTHSARKSVTFDDMEQFRDLPRRQPPATLPDRSRLNSSPPAVTEFGVRRDLEGAASIPVQGSGRRHGQVDGLPLSQSTPSLSGLAAQPRGSGGLPSANGEAAAFLAHMRATSPAVTPRRRSPPSTISQSGAMSSPLPMPPPPKIGTSGSWTPPSPSGSSPSTPSGFLPPKMTAGSFSRNSSADSLNNPFYQPTMPPYMRQSSQSDDGHGSPRSVSYHEGSGSSNGKRRGGAAPPKLRSAGPSMEDMSRISQYQQGMLPPMPTMPGIPSSPSGPPMQLRPSNQPAPVSNGKLPRSALATYSRSQRDIVKLPFTYAGPGTYPIAKHLSHPILLGQLLSWIDEDDWRGLWCLSSRIRKGLSRNPELREIVLERFLWSVGYRRWTWRMQESLAFSLADLDAYMRGAMAPEVLWKAVAADRQNPHIGLLAASARSYTRLVIRLRLQAEATATMANFAIGRMSYASTHSPQSQFKSPLYRPGQAPLFRVFVRIPMARGSLMMVYSRVRRSSNEPMSHLSCDQAMLSGTARFLRTATSDDWSGMEATCWTSTTPMQEMEMCPATSTRSHCRPLTSTRSLRVARIPLSMLTSHHGPMRSCTKLNTYMIVASPRLLGQKARSAVGSIAANVACAAGSPSSVAALVLRSMAVGLACSSWSGKAPTKAWPRCARDSALRQRARTHQHGCAHRPPRTVSRHGGFCETVADLARSGYVPSLTAIVLTEPDGAADFRLYIGHIFLIDFCSHLLLHPTTVLAQIALVYLYIHAHTHARTRALHSSLPPKSQALRPPPSMLPVMSPHSTVYCSGLSAVFSRCYSAFPEFPVINETASTMCISY
ncbi:hypothetical protein BKA62DRAFT_446039 [Auriculariales sp. MPI-PUGE-AT-0066]|nr:hypothetical protein BKA62DRAFT_446039 [Auriculariales sp. MPI-PUGE-AT-0066]